MSKSDAAGALASKRFTGELEGFSRDDFYERAVKIDSGIQVLLSDLNLPSEEEFLEVVTDPDVDSVALQRGEHPLSKRIGRENNWRYFRVGKRRGFQEESGLEFEYVGEGEEPDYLEDTPLIETIFSDVFQDLRLKNQHGPWAHKRDVYPEDRYEHSIGVMNLLRRHGAIVEEQLGGLFHDIGHGPMSHFAEEAWAKVKEGEVDHEYHEELIKERLKGSELSGEFDKFDVDFEQIIHDYKTGNFTLLEFPKPDICADRWDYFAREALTYGVFSDPEDTFGPLDDHPSERGYPDWSVEDVKNWNEALTVHSDSYGGEKHEAFQLEAKQPDSRFVMDDVGAATEAARAFIDMSRGFWRNPVLRAQAEAYEVLAAEAIQETGVSRREFFEMTDEEAIGMMAEYDQETLHAINTYFTEDNIEIVGEEDDWDMMLESGYDWGGEIDPEQGTGYNHTIDPLVKESEDQKFSEMKRASHYDEKLAQQIEEHERWAAQDQYVRVERFDFDRISEYT